MKVTDTNIADVKIIEPTVFGDERGYFMETWSQEKFDKLICSRKFVQDNHSKSSKGILRGLHYQTVNTQGKLVRVIHGEVYDVAVDLRQSSSSFGCWVGVYLSAENKKQLWIPEGFAHGFYVTSESAEFVYKCTDYYNPQCEQSIIWNDQDLDIKWPIDEYSYPLLSEKDKCVKSFKEAIHF